LIRGENRKGGIAVSSPASGAGENVSMLVVGEDADGGGKGVADGKRSGGVRLLTESGGGVADVM